MARLEDLGLSEYQARVYRALLSTGPTTAKELSRASDVPMGRIYDVLSDLETLEVVRSQNASRPKKYAPVDPETALDRLLEEKRRDLETEIRQYERTVEELAGRLEAAEPTEQFWTVAVGPGDAVDLLVERLGTATDRIVMIAGEPSAGFDVDRVGERIIEELGAALDRGTTIRVLVSASLMAAVSDDLLRRHHSTIVESPDFDLRVVEGLSGSFTLVDDAEVCIEVPNPLDRDEAFALIDVTDPEFAANLAREFEPRWERADPFP